MTEVWKPGATIIGSTEPPFFCYLVTMSADGAIAVTLRMPADPIRSLSHRIRTARRLFISWMGRQRPLERTMQDKTPTFIFALHRQEEIEEVCALLDVRLQALFDKPLPAKYVDVLLNITGKERRRWTKDGRLPATGHVMSSRTKGRFAVPLFSVDLIERLRNEPELIAQWRKEDAAGTMGIGTTAPDDVKT